MSTFTAFTTLASKTAAHALGEALETLPDAPTGVGVFEVEDGSNTFEVAGYFLEHPDDIALDLLAAAHGAAPFAVSKVDDRDWVAQVRRELSPVHAGRFVVYGSHDADQIPSNKIGLLIEAAMAFGTGHHGTTAGCLCEIDELVREGFAPQHIADVGTGTGVLAMAAARVWGSAAIVASDIDPVAVATARANVLANKIGPRVLCLQAAGLRAEPLRARGPYDLLLANILARPLKRMAPDMAALTVPGARIVLSGILNRQAAGVTAVFAGHGFHRLRQRRISEWTTLVLQRA